MRKSLFLTVFLLPLLVACTDEPKNQVAGRLGDMLIQRDHIGVGQPVDVRVQEYAEPVGTVTARSMTWILNGKALVSDDNQYSHGLYSRTIYPDKAGENVLELSVDYVFKVKGGDGLQIRNVTQSTSFVADSCDVRTSFWGDDIAQCQLNEYKAEMQPGDNNTYEGSYWQHFPKRQIYLYYHFENQKLVSLEEKQYNSLSQLTDLNDYSVFIREFLTFKDTMDARYNGGERAELSVTYSPEATEAEKLAWEDTQMRYTNDLKLHYDNEKVVGVAMAQGHIQPQASYVTARHTQMLLYAEKANVGNSTAVFFTQQFTKK